MSRSDDPGSSKCASIVFFLIPVVITITKQFYSIVLVSENGPARPGSLSEFECGVKVKSGLLREAEGEIKISLTYLTAVITNSWL